MTSDPDFKVTTFFEVEYREKSASERQSYYCTIGNWEWYCVCWPRLTDKRVAPVVNISWASCYCAFQISIHGSSSGLSGYQYSRSACTNAGDTVNELRFLHGLCKWSLDHTLTHLLEYLFNVIDTNWRTLSSPHQSCYIILSLYADDILLIAPSVLELESLFHACECELSWLDVAINYKWVRLVDPNFKLVCAILLSFRDRALWQADGQADGQTDTDWCPYSLRVGHLIKQRVEPSQSVSCGRPRVRQNRCPLTVRLCKGAFIVPVVVRWSFVAKRCRVIQLQKYTSSIHSVRRANMTLGSWKANWHWHTLSISILLVFNNFIRNLLITKSMDDNCDMVNGHASRPYSNTGMHLLKINWRVTSSVAILPTLPNWRIGYTTTAWSCISTF